MVADKIDTSPELEVLKEARAVFLSAMNIAKLQIDDLAKWRDKGNLPDASSLAQWVNAYSDAYEGYLNSHTNVRYCESRQKHKEAREDMAG